MTKGAEPRTRHDWHLWHVFNDAEFNNELATIKQLEKESAGGNDEIQALRPELAASFHITINELNRYELSQLIYLDHNERTTSLDIDKEAMTGTISFDLLTTTKDEIEQQFSVIEALRKIWNVKPVRRRASDQPSLIYAVFKAKRYGKTFRQIYELYAAGQLDGYSGSTRQFGDEESLERYYRKYQP